MKRENEEKLLKLEYDWDKTALFSLIGVLLTSCIGYYSTQGIFRFVLVILMIACIIVIVDYFFRIKNILKKIKYFYKN